MIIKEARLLVGDNSDAQVALCIHTNKKKNKLKASSLANFVKCTIKKRVTRRNNIKKRVNWFLVCATRKKLFRKGGECLVFATPKVALVDDKQQKLSGTRIKGVMPREIKQSGAPELVLKARRLV